MVVSLKMLNERMDWEITSIRLRIMFRGIGCSLEKACGRDIIVTLCHSLVSLFYIRYIDSLDQGVTLALC